MAPKTADAKAKAKQTPKAKAKAAAVAYTALPQPPAPFQGTPDEFIAEAVATEEAMANIPMASTDTLETILPTLAEKAEAYNRLLNTCSLTLEARAGVIAAAKSKAVKDAQDEAAKEQERAERVGGIDVRVILPDNSIMWVRIDKGRTIGALRRRIIHRCQKNGFFKKLGALRDIVLVNENGDNFTSQERPHLYNCKNFLASNMTLRVMRIEDFTQGMDIGVPEDIPDEPEDELEEDDGETDDED
eukprot:Skav216235  [mRNA]  locus=scaffold5243:45825:46559:+ [translate_table: standard]